MNSNLLIGIISCLTVSIVCVILTWIHVETFMDYGQIEYFLIFRNNFTRKSTCNEEVTKMGPGQKVVTYSFFVETKEGINQQEFNVTTEADTIEVYLGLRDHLAQKIAEYYPGWRMRIYTNLFPSGNESLKFPNTLAILQNFSSFYPHVDICDINYVKAHEVFSFYKTNTSTIYKELVPFGVFWRWLPLGDPTVESFISRDIDSYILPREVAAVSEWLDSSRQFHVMRDVEPQTRFIHANTWGAHNMGTSGDTKAAIILREKLMHGAIGDYYYGADQDGLCQHIWPYIKEEKRTFIHDDFRCMDRKYGYEIHPFPTQRVNFTWCGFGPKREHIKEKVGKRPCPVDCRPKENLDWTYC